ncbi:hypothetical protein STEG23_026296, partial [Scotinomys teguina]
LGLMSKQLHSFYGQCTSFENSIFKHKSPRVIFHAKPQRKIDSHIEYRFLSDINCTSETSVVKVQNSARHKCLM